MNDRLVALIDMDCFYCQVETRITPSLRGKPMAVVQYNQWKGGGIIAVNYEARDRGVTRHMRGAEAKKHCPEIQLVSVPSVRGKADLTKYRDAGREVIKVICEFSECVQRASVDEAYIDLTEAVEKHLQHKVKVTPSQLENTFVLGYCPEDNHEAERERGVYSWLEDVYSSDLSDPALHRLATATALVEQMRAAIYEKTGFRCSAGISHNKILAKLVCGLHKPNRQTVLPVSGVAELYRSLPVKKVRNLGGKFGKDVVEKLGITYMAELANFTEKQLQTKYDEKTSTWLYNIARGIDLDPVTPRLVSKSIGCCKNFQGKTALRTKQNVTHWLSELASEVAERLDEDIYMNKRKAQLLTIHFSQGMGRKAVTMSRSVALPGYDAEKIAVCAFNVLSKNSSPSHSEDDWYPPLSYLGLSVGKFMDYSGNSNGSIDKFFKISATTSKESCNSGSNVQELKPLETTKYRPTSEEAVKEVISDRTKDFAVNVISENNKVKTITNRLSDTGKSNERGSFFEKYFKDQPNKIIINRPITKVQNKRDTQAETSHQESSTIEDLETNSNIINNPEVMDEYMDIDGNVNFQEPKVGITEATTAVNNSEDSWISPSEIFPDLENIDDSIVNILPSPLQRKILQIKNSKSESSSVYRTKEKENVFSFSRASTDSDCAPTRVETVVDIHGSSGKQNVASSSSKCVIQSKPTTEDVIEPEGMFDRTSLDLFELELDQKLEDEVQSVVCDECSYCKESIPVSELPEHLDHHVAMELHEQLNREPQPDRTMNSNKIRTSGTVTVLSDKKKRGRPSKKEVVAPKKPRTIMSFFTKS